MLAASAPNPRGYRRSRQPRTGINTSARWVDQRRGHRVSHDARPPTLAHDGHQYGAAVIHPIRQERQPPSMPTTPRSTMAQQKANADVHQGKSSMGRIHFQKVIATFKAISAPPALARMESSREQVFIGCMAISYGDKLTIKLATEGQGYKGSNLGFG